MTLVSTTTTTTTIVVASTAVAAPPAQHRQPTPEDALNADLRICDRLMASLRDKFKAEKRLWFKCMHNNVKPLQRELRAQLKAARHERREIRREKRLGTANQTTPTAAPAAAAAAPVADENRTFVNRRFAVATFADDVPQSRPKAVRLASTSLPKPAKHQPKANTSADSTTTTTTTTVPTWAVMVDIFEYVRRNQIIDDDLGAERRNVRLLSAQFESRQREHRSPVDQVPALVFEDFD